MADPLDPGLSLTTLAVEVVDRARRAGADHVFATVQRSTQTELQRRDGATERLLSSTSRSVSVQLWASGRYSHQTTTDLRPAQLDAFLADALALTRALEPDPARQLADPSLHPASPQAIDLVDPALAAGLSVAEQEAWVEAIEARARESDRLISVTSGISVEANQRACASSDGFTGQTSATQAWPSAEVTLRDEGDRRAADGFGFGARYLTDLPEPTEIGQRALAMTLARLGARKASTRKGTMVVDPQVSGSLISRLLGPADARAFQQQRSFLLGKQGTAITSSRLTITDDPFLSRGFGSRPFDGEGIGSQVRPIVEAGVLRNIYVDTYYGRKAGLPVTTGSPSNRVVGLGERDRDQWIKEVQSGILVTSWMGGNADLSTGDFSLGIRGHLIERGAVGAPVGEMVVTGNLLSLFAGLVGLGNDPWRCSTVVAPTLVFEGVQFAGAQ